MLHARGCHNHCRHILTVGRAATVVQFNGQSHQNRSKPMVKGEFFKPTIKKQLKQRGKIVAKSDQKWLLVLGLHRISAAQDFDLVTTQPTYVSDTPL